MGVFYVWSCPEWADIVRHELMCLYPAQGYLPAEKVGGLLLFALFVFPPEGEQLQRLRYLVTIADEQVTYVFVPVVHE